jgi:hypothetical protein
MRSRRSGSGWPSGDTRVFGRRVTSKAPSAHVEGGSGHSEASPTAILQDTHSVEGNRLLKNSPLPTSGPRLGFKNACFEALKLDLGFQKNPASSFSTS